MSRSDFCKDFGEEPLLLGATGRSRRMWSGCLIRLPQGCPSLKATVPVKAKDLLEGLYIPPDPGAPPGLPKGELEHFWSEERPECADKTCYHDEQRKANRMEGSDGTRLDGRTI